MTLLKEKINVYLCRKCLAPTITIERVKGTTPMFLGCKAIIGNDSCSGIAVSQMYPTGDLRKRLMQGLKPEWEWYEASQEEINHVGPEMKEHIRKGGLLLRKIE